MIIYDLLIGSWLTAAELQNPKYTKAMSEMQRDPKAAMARYQVREGRDDGAVCPWGCAVTQFSVDGGGACCSAPLSRHSSVSVLCV